MICYTKKDIGRILRRLKYLLRHHSKWIVIKKLRGACAIYETEGVNGPIHIILDPRKELISGLIHEALHHWHPDWSEKKVERNETCIMNALTPKQAKNVIKELAKCF